jgi:thiamine transport system ATP-binding protein
MSLLVDDITVRFGSTVVLDHLTIDVGDGEVLAVRGPSGSGKSTLLRVIAGLIEPDSGRVLVDSRDVTHVPTHRRGIGMVFQDNQLFDHLDVAANIAFGLRMQHMARADRHRRVQELLAMIGLQGLGGRRVSTLSGGEAKRVALARSLAPVPRIVLLDEPLTGLDDERRMDIADQLADVLRATGTTALLVTHSAEEAELIADRVMSMPNA